MTKAEFLEQMQNVLQTEDVLTEETILDDLAEWDSVAMTATMLFMDKHFGVKVGVKDFMEMNTMADLMAKARV